MASKFLFTQQDMAVDEHLGYPKAYAKLCRDPLVSPYGSGPPSTFTPFSLPPQEVSRARDLDQLFPVIDPEAKPSTKPKNYVSLLWKQLNHLGNAGFDPAKFRVDPYGNVLYYHADSASPLAWDIDHYFPYSRGGRTVPSNLRILQRKVCKKKHNKLEFLVPWWDLQLGVSVNQFLSVFASSNSDFRNRAFSLLFFDGENEELNDSQSVDSHVFPQHFMEMEKKLGLAPAAIVLSRKESSDATRVLGTIDLNRRSMARPSITDAKKFLDDDNESLSKSIQLFRPSISKENDCPDNNPYLTIAMARDSLRQREEMQTEIRKLDMELDELNNKNETERIAIEDLESALIKRRRRAERSRRLAEAQSSYKALLEKMIRDAMHQSVIYKEQLRLNQAATNALMARLEAQKTICASSESELHRKFKVRDEFEKQIRPHGELARKRSRTEDILHDEEGHNNAPPVLYLPEIKAKKKPLQKELRVFLEEEHKESEARSSVNEEEPTKQETKLSPEIYSVTEKLSPQRYSLMEKPWEYRSLNAVEDETAIEDKLQKLDIGEVKRSMRKMTESVLQSPEKEDEECRKERGKGNVEKWLQILLNESKEPSPIHSPQRNTPEEEKRGTEYTIEKLRDIKTLKFPISEEKHGFNQKFTESKKKAVPTRDGEKRSTQTENCNRSNTSEAPSVAGKGVGSCQSFEGKERSGKDKGLGRSESARIFRPAPYSPSVILGMRKGVDCIGKKPIVIGSDEEGDADHRVVASNIFKSSIKTIKRAVKK